jgi:hypothetical protein
MHALIKKIHMYIGLLNFSNLMVFGIAGLAATFQEGHSGRCRRASALPEVPAAAGGDGQADRRPGV